MMRGRTATAQLEMFQRQVAGRDIVDKSHKMPPHIWAAIVALRKAGHEVYRRRRSHAVNGAQVTTLQLLKMAEECRKPQQSPPTSSST